MVTELRSLQSDVTRLLEGLLSSHSGLLRAAGIKGVPPRDPVGLMRDVQRTVGLLRRLDEEGTVPACWGMIDVGAVVGKLESGRKKLVAARAEVHLANTNVVAARSEADRTIVELDGVVASVVGVVEGFGRLVGAGGVDGWARRH